MKWLSTWVPFPFQQSGMVEAMRDVSFLALHMCLPLRRNAGISRGLHRLNISYVYSVAQTTRRRVPAHVFMKWRFYADGTLRSSQ